MGRAATRSLQVLLVASLVWAVAWTATRVPLVLNPLLIALVLASAISPAVRRLTEAGWPRALAVGTSFVIILAVFAGIIGGIIALIRQQSAELAARTVDGVNRLHAFLNTGPLALSDTQLETIRQQLERFFSSGSLGADAVTGLRTAGEILAGMVLMAVILFFFLKDGEQIRSFLIGFLPQRHQAKAQLAAERSGTVLGGYVRGTAIIAAIDALIVLAALLILQVPLALPLAVFVFIGGFIPIIGATVAGTLAVLVALVANGPVPALIVLAVLIGANQLEHHVLQPLLMGKVLHMNGLVIVLALTSGAMLAGVVGALLAVPLTAVGWTVFKTWSGREAPGPEPIDPNASEAVV
ncbi:AI-2E family transporter [Arthrobacter sp. I2-34]|uniref:AI-2E family transporter n=1 Tax=Arthrobacter hankyongi TaxID=2904801 RepID=A0ABS9LCN3_9MICC|nr:AI-2E family transporter [Arthrobacter hankyongi]MCG2624437.1 AI-2E family transporter [Arthrobacter hankyongi]